MFASVCVSMAALGETEQRLDLDIVWENTEGSVRKMHVSDMAAEKRWANLKSQGEGRRFYSHPNPEAELPQFPEGTPRRIRLGHVESRAIKDRERPAGGFVFPNRAHLPPQAPRLVSTFSLPGA